MDILYQVKKIKDCISSGDLRSAFKIIQGQFLDTLRLQLSNQIFFDKFEQELSVLSAFYSRIENSKKIETINNKEYQTDLNIINKNFLNILNEIVEKINSASISFKNIIGVDTDIFQGFHKEDVDTTLIKTAEHLEKARHFRVVGVGRQYVNQFRNINSVKKYYEAIENRIKNSKNPDRFRYRRITIMELTEGFQSHLLRCFENADKNDNKVELILSEDIEMQFTYYIIDEDLVVINLYTYSTDNVLDCPYAYWSNEPETINLFINHFDRVCRREYHYGNIINSKEEFLNFVPFNEKIIESLREIRSSIRRLPRESARTSWAINELQQTKDRLKGLTEYSLGIKNKITNGKLLVLFSYYVRQLKEGDEYLTVSFFEFWENITSEDTNEFYNANRAALTNGANLTRLYIINNSKITTDEYIVKQKLIIKMHYNLMQSFKNYKFELLFMRNDNYMRYLLEYKNFAIWKSGKESILFRPEYVYSGVSSIYPSMTYLHYIDDSDISHVNYNDNKEILENAEIDFNEILKKQKNQKYTDEQNFFIQSCGID